MNALDGKGRAALALAVKACVDSLWTEWRSPKSVDLLSRASAPASSIECPPVDGNIDELLHNIRPHSGSPIADYNN
jgi:hypothetical protein